MKTPKDTYLKDGPKDAPGADDAPTAHLQARILAEAIPHLIRYDEQTVVVKFGGNAMGDQALADAFAHDEDLGVSRHFGGEVFVRGLRE